MAVVLVFNYFFHCFWQRYTCCHRIYFLGVPMGAPNEHCSHRSALPRLSTGTDMFEPFGVVSLIFIAALMSRLSLFKSL